MTSRIFPTSRASQVISKILGISINQIQRHKHLYPIALMGDTGTQGRVRLRYKTHLDLDDGCMRAISLAVRGTSKIRVYCGQPR